MTPVSGQIVSRQWVPGAAVVPQERGPEFLGAVDGAEWSIGHGFYRGFFAAFAVMPGKDVWFHFPLPTPVVQDGRQLYLESVSFLWECSADARIGWVTVQHGGLERLALTGRMAEPASTPIPHEVAEEDRKYFPESDRRLTELALSPALPLRFGVQLCIMVSGGQGGGTVRFHGAGAAFAAHG